MTAKDKLMVIATSAPNSRPEYRRDLLSCFCYPDGVTALFSYRKSWIQKELVDDHKNLTGKRALIVFCDYPQDPTRDDFRFLPMRYATFAGFEPMELLESTTGDPHIAVRFTLDRFVYPYDTSQHQQWMLEQQGNYPRPYGHPQHDASHFVLYASDFTEGSKRSDELSWSSLAEHLAAAKTLADSTFFRIATIEELSRRSRKSVAVEDFRSFKARVFKSGVSYAIKLQFHLNPGSAAPSKLLVPRVSTDSIRITQPLLENIALTTNATIIANCNRVYTKEITTLVIEDPGDTKFQTARAEFVVILQPARWVLPLVILLLVVGTFSSSISADSIRELVEKGSWLEGHASGLEFILKGLGSLLVGLGAYLGFRKIPSSSE